MPKTYAIIYDYHTLCEVSIDEEKAAPSIKEMVEFWSGAEGWLEDENDDYTKVWLKNLGNFILRESRAPNDDEGWLSLDGEYGITVGRVSSYDFDRDQIEIEETAGFSAPYRPIKA